jgi:Sulfotransferase family
MNLSTPVIVISPAVRSGTTLVQRLLCSAPDTLIYGDTVGQEVEFFAKYTMVKEQMLQFQESRAVPVRSAVLGGDTADFITPLAPTAAGQIAGLRAAAMAWLRVCAEEAAAAGRAVWGWKLAGADGMLLPLLAAWFPEARWILVRRDLRNCFRSAKAANMMSGPQEAADFALAAAAVTAAFEKIAPRALVLDYAAMTADPAGTVRALESFTGARGIDAGVFKVRVNQLGRTASVPPADLTAGEEAALSGAASPLASPPAKLSA